MFGSTIINRRQHVGLQQLSALAGITHSSLGPNKTCKFIQDDTSGESALVCSCFRVLESLELTCAVGQLVHETVKAHQEVYHTGTGCLLFLAGAWSRVSLECLQRGISVAHIVSALSEGMDICVDVLRKCSISTDGLGGEQSKSLAVHLSGQPIAKASQTLIPVQRTTQAGYKTLDTSGQRRMKLSRHFCEAKSENVSTVPQSAKPPDIAHIAEGLSHGCVDAMNLVVETSRLQSRNNLQSISCSTFDVTKVLTCALPGLPEESACVLPGCIVLLSAEQASVAHHLKDQQVRVALINGDLLASYRHLGFKRPRGVQRVSDRSDVPTSSKEDKWMQKVVTLLLNLDVKLILVSGLVSEKVIQLCCSHHILVVEKVKASVSSAFAVATGAVVVTYVTQLSKQCVGTGVNVVVWRDLSSHERKPSAAVNISTSGSSDLVTAILTSCVEGKLQVLEDQFWACAHRLHCALKDQMLLPGAGVTEMLCVHHLQKKAEHHGEHRRERDGASVQQTRAGPANRYRSEVLHLMADGFIDYISTVMVNTGQFSKVRARTAVSQQLQRFDQSPGSGGLSSPMRSSEPPAANIYDNLSVKQEAWRKALDLVLLVLQTDAEVITGMDQKTENLMLL